MKKFLIILCVLLAIVGVAVVTCPDKQAHKDAIMEVVNEKIMEEVGAQSEENPDLSGLLNGIASLGSHIGGWYLGGSLSVHNYFVCSIGSMTIDGEKHTVSVGVFGHVFTFSKEDLDKAMEELS